MRDRISALPDEIVSIILSLLTIKEARCTSVLSQRWINSWKLFAGSLNFDGSKTMGRMIKERATMSLETERTKYMMWVDEVLNFYQGKNIKEFRVCFDLQKDFACIIDGWINFAIERRVQRLELDLTTYRGNRQGFDYYTLPSSPLGASSLNTLTALRLKSVDLREDILNQLLSDCPLIEELCVSYSPSLVNVRIAGPSKLKYLEVSFCFNLVNVEISAMNLVSFKYFGSKLCHPLKNVPMLSNVYIGGCYCESVVWTSFDDLSKVLYQLETLILDISSTAERSYLIPVTFPEFCNLKQLELTVTAYADQCILFLSRFLNASPGLYKLVVKIRFVQASESNMQEPDIVQIVPFEGKPRLSIRGRHECLKIVEIVGWVGTVADSELAIYLLEKAVSLDKIILDPRYPSILDKHEENHQPKLHGGLVIKHNANQRYATNSITSFIFREIAMKHNLPIQDFVVRNDMPCGSTIGPILASGTGIRTVDVGAPQLSMHSIREMCAVDDVKHSYEHFKAFFQEFSHLDSKIVVDI